MASKDGSSTMPNTPSDASFPDAQLAPAASSVISSRMTDIASEDGDEYQQTSSLRTPTSPNRQSLHITSDGRSRPGTSTTGVSSRGPWAQSPPSRRGLNGLASHRLSLQGSQSIASRPQSASSRTSRTHVPSLSQYAFFRPMSSQRLQAQRGGSRPPTRSQDGLDDRDSSYGETTSPTHSRFSYQTLRPSVQDDGEIGPPPSRGTEVTEPETPGRLTLNGSPPYVRHEAESMSESVRPLNKGPSNPKGLRLNIDKSYKTPTGFPTPSKSPMSFGSGLRFTSRENAGTSSPNRSTHGREKLSSLASSPVSTSEGASHVSKADYRTQNLKSGKNYEYFSGNTRFWCGGRLQNARDRPIVIATCLLAFTPGVLFLIFSAPWLWHHISPAIPIVFAYIFYICISSFIHASVSDPGILPRNLHRMPPANENDDPLRLAPSTTDWILVKSASSANAAMEMPIKYCKTCNIWRPPRGHHCRICDNCIESHDHHCVWLNNCVGRRNYRYFFGFVSFASIMGGYIFAASLAQIIVYMDHENISFGAAINHFRVPFAMVIYSFIATLYPLALMAYHLFLMGRGETTREYLNSHKFIKSERHRAFTQGNIFKNWIVVLCRPRSPTYLSLKGRYEMGDQRFGERRGNRTTPPTSEAQSGRQGIPMQELNGKESGFQGPAALERSPGG
ncbi:MAG: Eukaryotic peptide chain release factor GTP-binding subunit [Claussenomyces sp. TS43310]|nr:MAG: Eukaryotic peptide chain release factor GTP-binding subunit [Claussenomyces sp. TS43310]